MTSVPPSWLTIVKWTMDRRYNVTVNHGKSQETFICSSNTPVEAIMSKAWNIKRNLMLSHDVADALDGSDGTHRFFGIDPAICEESTITITLAPPPA